jgi:hypothetical protein
MEEFGFDNMDNIGTNIQQLKTENNTDNSNIKELSKIKQNDMLKPKKQVNMNLFVKKLEKDLQKFKSSDISSDIQPSNTNNFLNNNDIITKKIETIDTNIPVKTSYVSENIYFEIIISMLIFMLLSHSVFNNLFKSEYISLGIKTLLFGIILFSIKKLNL